MPLFSTDPVVLNDGSADRSFSFKGQTPTKNADDLAGTYYEPAAPLSEDSTINVKHSTSKNTCRHLLQMTGEKVIIDGITNKPITVNITITHHVEHTEAQIEKYFKICTAAASKSGFLPQFTRGVIQ